jgi:hypothetical protein
VPCSGPRDCGSTEGADLVTQNNSHAKRTHFNTLNCIYLAFFNYFLIWKKEEFPSVSLR